MQFLRRSARELAEGKLVFLRQTHRYAKLVRATVWALRVHGDYENYPFDYRAGVLVPILWVIAELRAQPVCASIRANTLDSHTQI